MRREKFFAKAVYKQRKTAYNNKCPAEMRKTFTRVQTITIVILVIL